MMFMHPTNAHIFKVTHSLKSSQRRTFGIQSSLISQKGPLLIFISRIFSSLKSGNPAKICLIKLNYKDIGANKKFITII